ncbi:MAG: orotate phosphoribosyltransferase [Chloroflexota bacterium]
MSEAVAEALLDIGAVGFSPTEPITFKSGIVSPVYVDNRKLPYHPKQWRIVVEQMKVTVETLANEADIIAGVAVGGVPHSSALGYALERPSVFVRKEAKGHGKGKRVEGGDIVGKRVLLVEDLVTTGGSSLSGVEALRVEGAIVEQMIAIVSYGFQEAREAFVSAGVTLCNLTEFETILDVALARGMFDEAQQAIIRDWFDDPHGWASRHF